MQRGDAAGVVDRADGLVGGDGYVDATSEPGEVVEGGDGLLDELEVEPCEPPDHRLGRVEVPGGVGVDAHRDVGTDRVAHRRNEVEVVARLGPPNLHLHCGKAGQSAGIDRATVHQRVDGHRVAHRRRPAVTRGLLGGAPRRAVPARVARERRRLAPARRADDERHLPIPDAEPVLPHAVTNPMLNSTATTSSRRAVATSAATSDGGSRRVMTSRTGCTASGSAANAIRAGG